MSRVSWRVTASHGALVMGPPLRLWRGIGRQFGRGQSSSLVCHSSPAGILLPCGGTSSQGKVDGLDTDCSVTGADRRFKRANCPQALPANLLGASTSSPPLRNDAAHDRPAGCPRVSGWRHDLRRTSVVSASRSATRATGCVLPDGDLREDSILRPASDHPGDYLRNTTSPCRSRL